MKKRRLLGSILAMTLALGLAACAGRGGTGTQADKPQESRPAAGEYKVAVLLPGSINDGGWSTTGYEAAKKAAETIGAEFSYTETKSPQDAVDALTDYGERGFTMVFCHSYDYQDACAKVAPDYPNTQFITSGGTIMTENVTLMNVTRWNIAQK